jgi:UDPglucose 6-dehydrogenase
VKLAVIGAGHVGLPTAAVLARLGHEVRCSDDDVGRIEALAEGRLPFFEPGLQSLVEEGIESGRLTFWTSTADVLQEVRAAFLCVGTPPKASGEASLAMIERAATAIAREASGPLVVVEKSTVPAGTAERISKTLQRFGAEAEFTVVSNPEFLREGRAVEDSLDPSRILVGSDSPQSFDTMREIYAPLIDQGVRWIETDLRTAELSKHASNAFLALKVSFVNALARICEAASADIIAVTEVMAADPRIGSGHLSAGLGYGGSCFPKDLLAFEHLSRQLGYDFPLLREIARINDEAVDAAVSKIEDVLWNLEDKRIAVLGLSFKPGTDDIRFSPALALAEKLLAAGAHVAGYDPAAAENAEAELPKLQIADDIYSALDGAHCAVVATEWEEFLALDLDKARRSMALPNIVDARNLFDPQVMGAAGFTYIPTGRPPTPS